MQNKGLRSTEVNGVTKSKNKRMWLMRKNLLVRVGILGVALIGGGDWIVGSDCFSLSVEDLRALYMVMFKSDCFRSKANQVKNQIHQILTYKIYKIILIYHFKKFYIISIIKCFW